MICLYAITDYQTPLAMPGGLRMVTAGELAALCGPVTTLELTADALWLHEETVETLMEDRDLLPVRYGTYLADDAAVAAVLHDNRAAYAAALDRVRGAVELAVRVHGPRAASAPPQTMGSRSGTEYLGRRAGVAAEESMARVSVHEPLARTARADSVAPASRAGELLRSAYLVARDATGSFIAHVRELQAANPRLQISCTGPWPPTASPEHEGQGPPSRGSGSSG